MDNIADIFERYEAVRHRLPQTRFSAATADIGSLLDVIPHADAFVFDAFGVLNVGETPIPGAAKRLEDLRAQGLAVRILSNAASYDHARAVAKLRSLGMAVSPEEVIISRDAALAGLGPGLWGCIAAPADDLSDIPAVVCRLEDNPADYSRADGVLFLSTACWTAKRQAALEQSLLERGRPLIIANADLVAPQDHGFSLEPGYFGHLLADRGVSGVRFFGKPFPEVYEMAEASLPGIRPERIVMCGDTLHTDIIGAAARGWRTVLVTRDGLFSGCDTRAYCDQARLNPDWRLPRI